MRARVKLTENPVETEIEVGGRRIEGAVRALTIRASAQSFTEIGLELATFEDVDAEGDVHVLMTETTRQALIALGWTPPAQG